MRFVVVALCTLAISFSWKIFNKMPHLLHILHKQQRQLQVFFLIYSQLLKLIAKKLLIVGFWVINRQRDKFFKPPFSDALQKLLSQKPDGKQASFFFR